MLKLADSEGVSEFLFSFILCISCNCQLKVSGAAAQDQEKPINEVERSYRKPRQELQLQKLKRSLNCVELDEQHKLKK